MSLRFQSSKHSPHRSSVTVQMYLDMLGYQLFYRVHRSYVYHLLLLQRRRFFRIKNRERGQFLSVQGGVDEMKSGRVVVSAQAEPMTDIWYYQDGLLKNKVALRVFQGGKMVVAI